MSTTYIDLYVAFGHRRNNDPLHWILLAVPQGSDRCTFYHVTGGPAQGKAYSLQIQANKRVNSFGVASMKHIGTIEASDINKLKGSAQRVTPQFCQTWLVDVLEDMEGKGLIDSGTAANYQAKVDQQ